MVGLPLDPSLAALLSLLPERSYADRTPEQSRAAMRLVADSAPKASDGVPREDGYVADVPVRRYGGASLATVVYLHGGGWVSGDLETHDAQCGRLAARTGATVLAVDYARAPEHPFPAGLEDALAVLRATVADVGQGHVAVAGDSAGANLAAAATLVMRDEGHALLAQMLLYPATDLRSRYEDDGSYPSRSENAKGPLLSLEGLRWFAGHYLTPGQASDRLASPILEMDLSGLPPAVIGTAQYDPLRDEGLAYGARLVAAGVRVLQHEGDGLVHGYAGAVAASAAAAAETDRMYTDFAMLLA